MSEDNVFVKRAGFTIIPNYLIDDRSVTANTLAAINYLASKVNWTPFKKDICARFGWGDFTWRQVSAEMRTLGVLSDQPFGKKGTRLVFELKYDAPSKGVDHNVMGGAVENQQGGGVGNQRTDAILDKHNKQQEAAQQNEDSEPGIDLPFVLNQARELGLSESIITKTIISKGLAATSKALALYAKRGKAANPYAWLNKCIKDKYWEDAANVYSDDIFMMKQPKYDCMEKLHSDALKALKAEGITEPAWDKLDPSSSYDKQVAFNRLLESKKLSLNIYT